MTAGCNLATPCGNNCELKAATVRDSSFVGWKRSTANDENINLHISLLLRVAVWEILFYLLLFFESSAGHERGESFSLWSLNTFNLYANYLEPPTQSLLKPSHLLYSYFYLKPFENKKNTSWLYISYQQLLMGFFIYRLKPAFLNFLVKL